MQHLISSYKEEDVGNALNNGDLGFFPINIHLTAQILLATIVGEPLTSLGKHYTLVLNNAAE